jgi:hypothetical protein
MSSVIVCGDIHGLVGHVRDLLQDKDQATVFVSDFVDSFDKNIDEQIECVDLVLEAIETRDNVTALIANHEYGYLNNRYACSGYEHKTQQEINKRKARILRNFRWYVIVDDFLVTHAGVSESWLPEKDMNFQEIVKYLDEAPIENLAQIGYTRGGLFPVGGILWCDTEEFKPVPGIKQVFGHSNYRPFGTSQGVWEVYPDNFNVDCFPRKREVLEINDGEASIRKF